MFWISRAVPVSRCIPPSLPGKNCLVVASVVHSPSPGPLWVLINLIEGGSFVHLHLPAGLFAAPPSMSHFRSQLFLPSGMLLSFHLHPPSSPWPLLLADYSGSRWHRCFFTNQSGSRLSSASRGIAHRSCELEPRLSKSGGSSTIWGWAEKALPPSAWTTFDFCLGWDISSHAKKSVPHLCVCLPANQCLFQGAGWVLNMPTETWNEMKLGGSAKSRTYPPFLFCTSVYWATTILCNICSLKCWDQSSEQNRQKSLLA